MAVTPRFDRNGDAEPMSTGAAAWAWWHRRGWPVARHLLLLPLVALFLLPLVWMVSTSLRAPGLPPPIQIEWVPNPVSWENYSRVFDILPIWTFAGNSLFVVAVAVPVTILVASLAGFAMSQLPRDWRMRLTVLSFIVLMVPITAVWVTRLVLFKQAGLTDSLWALIAPSLMGTSPFYVLLFLWTFLRVPPGVYEAARLDGASAWRIWAGVALPLARPTTAAVALLSFVVYWSDFINPLLYINTTEKQTLSLALQSLYQLERSDWPLLMAGAVLLTVPVVVAFLVAQRSFLQEFRGTGWGQQ